MRSAPSILLFAVLLLGGFAVSCQSTGNASAMKYSENFGINHRIKKNLADFENLSVDHKSSVSRGEICEGMTKQAVFLAWGKATQVMESSQNGQVLEQWTYLNSETVPCNSVGYNGSVVGGPPCANGGVNVGADVHVVNQFLASADFVDGKVVAWRRVR